MGAQLILSVWQTSQSLNDTRLMGRNILHTNKKIWTILSGLIWTHDCRYDILSIFFSWKTKIRLKVLFSTFFFEKLNFNPQVFKKRLKIANWQLDKDARLTTKVINLNHGRDYVIYILSKIVLTIYDVIVTSSVQIMQFWVLCPIFYRIKYNQNCWGKSSFWMSL